jgi:hypothetical protein
MFKIEDTRNIECDEVLHGIFGPMILGSDCSIHVDLSLQLIDRLCLTRNYKHSLLLCTSDEPICLLCESDLVAKMSPTVTVALNVKVIGSTPFQRSLFALCKLLA